MEVRVHATFSKKYQYQLSQIVSSFIDNVSPSLKFNNDEERRSFIDDKVSDLEQYYPESPESAHAEACDLMAFREHTEYQYLCNSVSLLFHTFEQQIIQVFYLEFVNGYSFSKSDFLKKYKYASSILKEIKEQSTIWWDNQTLDECRELNNAIKHGNGNSMQYLINSHPELIFEEYLQEDDIESFIFNSQIDNTILDKVFKISIDDLIRYRDALLNFWGNFPNPLKVEVNIRYTEAD